MAKKHKDTVKHQFGKTAEAFSKYAVRDTPEILAEKVQFSKAQSTDFALDVACGPGRFALLLAPHVRFVIGIDLTREMILQARKFQIEQKIPNAGFGCGDAEQLPCPDGAFDLVSCHYAFHHMSKPDLALREMIRVTKPEGRLLLVDSVAPESDAKFELHNHLEKLRDPSHTATLRLTTFLSMFEEDELEVAAQTFKRRPRSFDQWMLRAGLEPRDKRYLQVRQLVEDSISGDRAGFAPKPRNGDFEIVHNEATFLLQRAPQAHRG